MNYICKKIYIYSLCIALFFSCTQEALDVKVPFIQKDLKVLDSIVLDIPSSSQVFDFDTDSVGRSVFFNSSGFLKGVIGNYAFEGKYGPDAYVKSSIIVKYNTSTNYSKIPDDYSIVEVRMFFPLHVRNSEEEEAKKKYYLLGQDANTNGIDLNLYEFKQSSDLHTDTSYAFSPNTEFLAGKDYEGELLNEDLFAKINTDSVSPVIGDSTFTKLPPGITIKLKTDRFRKYIDKKNSDGTLYSDSINNFPSVLVEPSNAMEKFLLSTYGKSYTTIYIKNNSSTDNKVYAIKLDITSYYLLHKHQNLDALKSYLDANYSTDKFTISSMYGSQLQLDLFNTDWLPQSAKNIMFKEDFFVSQTYIRTESVESDNISGLFSPDSVFINYSDLTLQRTKTIKEITRVNSSGNTVYINWKTRENRDNKVPTVYKIPLTNTWSKYLKDTTIYNGTANKKLKLYSKNSFFPNTLILHKPKLVIHYLRKK